MGYTIYWKTREQLSEDDVRAALRFLGTEQDRGVFRVVSYTPGLSVLLNPVEGVHSESLFFFVFKGVVGLGFCKTGRQEPADSEVKRLLAGVNRILGGKLKVWCDDGVEYSAEYCERARVAGSA